MNGSEIKKMRDKLKWSQNTLAHAIFSHPTTINRWEKGKNKPSKAAQRELEKVRLLHADKLR